MWFLFLHIIHFHLRHDSNLVVLHEILTIKAKNLKLIVEGIPYCGPFQLDRNKY